MIWAWSCFTWAKLAHLGSSWSFSWKILREETSDGARTGKEVMDVGCRSGRGGGDGGLIVCRGAMVALGKMILTETGYVSVSPIVLICNMYMTLCIGMDETVGLGSEQKYYIWQCLQLPRTAVNSNKNLYIIYLYVFITVKTAPQLNRL